MKKYLTMLWVWITPFACNSITKETYNYADFPYNLTVPVQVIQLPNELEEISALSYLEDGKLACVQDEEGILYIIDIDEGNIFDQYNFMKDGDYEGLEVVGKTAYIIKSDGTLYEIQNYLEGNPEIKSYKTPLNSGNNPEGLTYDPAQNSLLIACKDNAFINKPTEHHRAVYQFNLVNKSFDPQPFYLIDEKKLSDVVQKKVNLFPSGISIHPLTHEVYLIASKSEMLVVMNGEGEIVAVKSLPRSIFKQPEGICFAPDGTLFIANEGRGGKGNILRFEYKKDFKH